MTLLHPTICVGLRNWGIGVGVQWMALSARACSIGGGGGTPGMCMRNACQVTRSCGCVRVPLCVHDMCVWIACQHFNRKQSQLSSQGGSAGGIDNNDIYWFIKCQRWWAHVDRWSGFFCLIGQSTTTNNNSDLCAKDARRQTKSKNANNIFDFEINITRFVLRNKICFPFFQQHPNALIYVCIQLTAVVGFPTRNKNHSDTTAETGAFQMGCASFPAPALHIDA